jgi:formylglycine-generating enzyme required for sulfatase activity
MAWTKKLGGSLTLALAACAAEPMPEASEPGTGAWDVNGGALAKLATPCTFDGTTKKFTVTLVDGESALVSVSSKGIVQVNGDACTSTETKKANVKSIDVKLADGFTPDGRGVRVLLDYSGGALVMAGTTAPVVVTLGGRAQDKVWLRTTAKPDYVNVSADGVVSVGTSATNTKKDVALSQVGALSLTLGAGADVLTAGAATLPIAVYGGGDNDVLSTGLANDLLDGGDGDDTLNGGVGDDWLDGGDGDDSLDGQGGCDGFFGGAGADTNLDEEPTGRIEQVELNFAEGQEACGSGGSGGSDTAGALTTKTFNGVSVEFSYIPAGAFKMGSPDSDTESYDVEKPQHDVTLTKPFLLARTEVTQQLWTAVMGNNPASFTGDDKRPVERVSWSQVQDFLAQLNIRDGGMLKYRLPTEAEWEYAARAGTTTPRYGTLDSIAWHSGNSPDGTQPVKGRQANAWNLFDMLGNVSEWTNDLYGGYAATAATDPQGLAPGTTNLRAVRGGRWDLDASRARRQPHRLPPEQRERQPGLPPRPVTAVGSAAAAVLRGGSSPGPAPSGRARPLASERAQKGPKTRENAQATLAARPRGSRGCAVGSARRLVERGEPAHQGGGRAFRARGRAIPASVPRTA